LSPTQPGTDIKVIPESVVPSIPYATIYQGEFRFPIKKASLLSLFAVIVDIINNKLK
tara:strand:- start:1300 stop:1470 length:171 start_codon:yes stop_codon:yes gene_type:complete